MPQIGTFTRNDDGFFGRVRTLTFDVEATILPIDGGDGDNVPNHRVFASGIEVGVAWDRTGDRAGAYLAVSIDDPSFVEPIRARLFASDVRKDVWNLLWSRKSKRDDAKHDGQE